MKNLTGDWWAIFLVVGEVNGGKDNLWCFIKGTTADEDGNITVESEATINAIFELAAATHNSGGKVICQVDRLAANGSLNAKDVKVPGLLVDAVVVGRPEYSRQSYAMPYNPALSAELKVPEDAEKKPEPLSLKKIIARRGAMEIAHDSFVNFGIGVPQLIASVLDEEGLADKVITSVESGVIGGVPSGGLGLGSAQNPVAIIKHPEMFDLYHGGALDGTFLGAAEFDEKGNVNVTKFNGKSVGPGGFLGISQPTPKVCFCGTFTAGKSQIEIRDGKLNIIKDGDVIKFKKNVEQITFSGEYAQETGQEVFFLTERAVLKLTADGVMVTEIAPGIDLEKDVIGHMGFRPLVAEDLKIMDARIFRPEKMGLAAGEPVCWATGIAPQEVLTAMDIATVYPENFGAAMGAKHFSGHFCEVAEADGYSIDICSYARNHFGYIKEGCHVDDPVNLPLPDVILCCSNTCGTVIKWYENLAKQLNVPCLFFDTPFVYHEGRATDHQVRYMEGEIYRIIEQLEELTGRKFDYDKFRHVMEISMQTGEAWMRAISVSKHTPSPICGFDMFNYMGVMVCDRGTEAARDLFNLWYEESMEKIARGEGPWKDQEEKYRILWDGIACWPQLNLTYKMLKKYGINMVASNYPRCWMLDYAEPTIAAMARAYAENIPMNRDIAFDYDATKETASTYNLDGMISHSNRSCKPMDFKQFEVRRGIMEEVGLPSCIFDGDQTDPKVFSEAQFETRLQALVEIMEKNKANQ